MGGNIEIITEKVKGEFFVKVDPGEFESALLNLALNARDAMSKGGTIRISAENQVLNKEAALALELESLEGMAHLHRLVPLDFSLGALLDLSDEEPC